jgi:hypothetical protein
MVRASQVGTMTLHTKLVKDRLTRSFEVIGEAGFSRYGQCGKQQSRDSGPNEI